MMSRVFEASHPLLRHHLTRLRDQTTRPAEFRSLLRQITLLLAVEATIDVHVRSINVQTPLTSFTGVEVAHQIALVPILRAGLGMVDPLLDLIPTAVVWHLGVYRDESTAQPISYYNKLPASAVADVAFVLDPMLATGGSAKLAIGALRESGVQTIKLISVIASRDGVTAVTRQFPDTQVFVGQIDAELDSRKYIVPGLGDAGDRIFNTFHST